MSGPTSESEFQKDVINQLQAAGYQLGKASDYDRERALYPSDALAYVKVTQPKTWPSTKRSTPPTPSRRSSTA